MTVEGKLFGRGRPLFPAFALNAPVGPTTLAALLACVVQAEVEAFAVRQQERSVLTALSATAITEGLVAGKVAPGLPEEALPAAIDGTAAVENALTAFRDGLYFVFVDDRQIQHLDEVVVLTPNTRLMFLRLVALAGG